MELKVFVQPDAQDRERIRQEGMQKLLEELTPKPQELVRSPMGGLTMWHLPGVERPRHLTPIEKIAREAVDADLTARATVRATTCWRCDEHCTHAPVVWVRDVQFDLKEDRANINHSIRDAARYKGAVPGFCTFHNNHKSAELLAQAVYQDDEIVHWGLRPRRWFVIYTDGTKVGGECVALTPKAEVTPLVLDELIGGTNG